MMVNTMVNVMAMVMVGHDVHPEANDDEWS